jgi:hypothetical protein
MWGCRYTFPSIDKVATLNSMAVAEFQVFIEYEVPLVADEFIFSS